MLPSGTAAAGIPPKSIAVHCVAGLGRAPLLVAVALIHAGLSPIAAIQLIRRRRRGAMNARQIHFLEHYGELQRRKRADLCVIS